MPVGTSEGLEGNSLTPPSVREWAQPVFHLYVIQTEKREELATFLKEKGDSDRNPLPHSQSSTASRREGSWSTTEIGKNR